MQQRKAAYLPQMLLSFTHTHLCSSVARILGAKKTQIDKKNAKLYRLARKELTDCEFWYFKNGKKHLVKILRQLCSRLHKAEWSFLH